MAPTSSARRFLLLLAAGVACRFGGGSAATNDSADTAGGSVELNVVAHEDDDLLFMSPDIASSIRGKSTLETVYLTAGDAGNGEAYWRAREDGIRAAYALMAGVEDRWDESRAEYGGKSVRRYVLAQAARISVDFVTLPDGGGALAPGEERSLERLHDGSLARASTKDGLNTFSRDELVSFLTALIEARRPQVLRAQDSSDLYGNDHTDHVAGGRFALDAHLGAAGTRALRLYRAYNIGGETANLAADDAASKWTAFTTYSAHDSNLCDAACLAGNDYGAWAKRQYVLASVHGRSGPLLGAGDLCVALSGAAAGPLRLAACDDGDAQRWSAAQDGTIQNATGLCLAAAADSISASPCDSSKAQRFVLFTNGQLRGTGGMCLDASGANLAMRPCADTPSQRFFFGLEHPATLWSVAPDFSDVQLASDPTYFSTVRLGDVNGDHRADACVRQSDGVHCALALATGHFGALSRFTEEFSDAHGWLRPEYGTTLELVDLDGDGRADVCGRGVDGLHCATARGDGAAFEAPRVWSTAGDFGDAWGVAVARSYYATLRFADVDGDGRPDACMRRADGIWCAHNDGASFGQAVRWLGDEFTDALGWLPERYGATIQLGDVDGDGRADVCGRGIQQVHCARSNGSSFVGAHPWSFRDDWSDAKGWGDAGAYWASVRLVDVDGDGRADVCGRGVGGIECGYSTGGAFTLGHRVMPREFTDGLGWREDRFGPTLMFGDVDGDGRVDACGRGAAGLLCVD